MNITYQQIKSFKPCYDPVEIGMPDYYSAKISDFITEYRDKARAKADILWVLLRNEFLSDKELRLYAVWCARQVQHLMIDQRSINALDVAERYANGLATDYELTSAREAATAASARRAAMASTESWSAERAAEWAAERELTVSAWAAATAAATAASWAARKAAAQAVWASKGVSKGASVEVLVEAASQAAQASQAVAGASQAATTDLQTNKLLEIFITKETRLKQSIFTRIKKWIR